MSWLWLSKHLGDRINPARATATANLWANAKEHLPRKKTFVLPEKLPPTTAAAIIVVLSLGLWALIIFAVKAAIG